MSILIFALDPHDCIVLIANRTHAVRQLTTWQQHHAGCSFFNLRVKECPHHFGFLIKKLNSRDREWAEALSACNEPGREIFWQQTHDGTLDIARCVWGGSAATAVCTAKTHATHHIEQLDAVLIFCGGVTWRAVLVVMTRRASATRGPSPLSSGCFSAARSSPRPISSVGSNSGHFESCCTSVTLADNFHMALALATDVQDCCTKSTPPISISCWLAGWLLNKICRWSNMSNCEYFFNTQLMYWSTRCANAFIIYTVMTVPYSSTIECILDSKYHSTCDEWT